MNANVDTRAETATIQMIWLFASYNMPLQLRRQIDIPNYGSAAEINRPFYGTKSAVIALEDTEDPAGSIQLNQ
jgi:hypothetical protein